MYLFYYALKNIVRNKGRYLLIGAVLIVSLTSVTVSAMIHFTTEAVIDNYADRFGAKVSFTPDLRKLLQLIKPDENGMYNNPEITTEQYILFSESEAVKSTLFRASRQTYGEKLTGLQQGGEENYYSSGAWEKDFGPLGKKPVQRQAPNTAVVGYSEISMMEEFNLGERELDEGSFFDAPGECIVSREFADLNNLKLGDSFDLQDVNHTEVEPLRLTVCGIYLDITTPQPEGNDWAVTNRRNEILTSFSTLEEHSMTGLYVTAEYYLNHPALGSEFEQYVRDNGLHEVYDVNVDSGSYYQIVKPVERLKNISSMFLAVILLVGCLVLILLSMLSIRERKYEIGVLRAIGMPKGKVVFSLICESVCVLLLCLCIGLGVGGLAAQPVSDVILEEQKELTHQQPKEGSSMADMSGSALALEELKINLAPESILLVAAVSLLLGLFTNIAGIVCIMRYEPMKILSEKD